MTNVFLLFSRMLSSIYRKLYLKKHVMKSYDRMLETRLENFLKEHSQIIAINQDKLKPPTDYIAIENGQKTITSEQKNNSSGKRGSKLSTI